MPRTVVLQSHASAAGPWLALTERTPAGAGRYVLITKRGSGAPPSVWWFGGAEKWDKFMTDAKDCHMTHWAELYGIQYEPL